MQRFLVAVLPISALLIAPVCAAENHGGNDNRVPVTITKVDAQKGEITVKATDPNGKQHTKTFRLTRDVRIFDETGRAVAIDVFESGDQALVLEREGILQELRRPGRAHLGQRLSDAVSTLIEMTDCDDGCVQEVQRIYDALRKLDTAKNGRIDPNRLKAERDRIVEERVHALMQRLDTNKDGKISKEEARGLIREDFDRLDRNRDGYLDFDELLQAAKQRRNSKPAEI
jgi:Ca2+-binding EF-hand superfamily protein